jgi:hypothetical protein
MVGTYPDAFKALVKFLEDIESRFGWRYMIVGGALTPLYAQSRMTQDIDVVLQISVAETSLSSLVQQLNVYGFKPFSNWGDTFHDWPRISMATFLDPAQKIKIDFNFITVNSKTTDVYKRIGLLAMPRRVRKSFLGLDCWIQSREDFIIAKLVYGGIQDYKDALACWMKFPDSLDVDYLNATTKELGVREYFNAIQRCEPVDQVFPD